MTDPRLNPFHDRLSVENAAMLLIDHQEGFFHGIKSIDTKELRNNIVALAKVALRSRCGLMSHRPHLSRKPVHEGALVPLRGPTNYA